jgi:hypothetical protein
MAEQERQLIYNCQGNASYWQYRNNPAEYQTKQPLKQENQQADDTWIILLGVIVTIGFLAMLIKTTI